MLHIPVSLCQVLLLFWPGAATRSSEQSSLSDGLFEAHHSSTLVHHSLQHSSKVDLLAPADPIAQLQNATNTTAPTLNSLREWRRAQADMLERTRRIRAWCADHHVRENIAQHPGSWCAMRSNADEDFFYHFVERFETNPDFYLGLVYIPIAWHFVKWNAVRTIDLWKRSHDPLNLAVDLLRSLPKNHKYFTIFMEESIDPDLYTAGIDWGNILVFDSRGADPDRWRIPRVAIPLLHREEEEVPGNSENNRSPEVFFRGTCSSYLRKLVPAKLASVTSPRYSWNVRPCGEKMPEHDFFETIRRETWVITTSGYFPPAYMMYEALQAGALPIFITTQRPWLPYRDLGVDWHKLLVVQPASELQSLPDVIEAVSPNAVSERQAAVQQLRPLFTVSGLAAYVLYVTSLAGSSPSLWSVVEK